jgi:hypothetical protein
MNTIASLDERIHAPEQELVQAKRRRNALTALCRLPDELIVLIAQHLIAGSKWERPRVFTPFLSVCQYLRTLLIDASMLWTQVHFTWSTTWIDRCLARSKSQNLDVSVSVRVNAKQAPRSKYEQVFQYLNRISSMCVEFYDSDLVLDFWNRVNSCVAFAPRKLVLHSYYTRMAPSDSGTLNRDACTHLTTLRLFRYSNIPFCTSMPVLQTVVLQDITLPLSDLRQLLVSSRLLQVVELRQMQYTDLASFVFTTDRVCLPFLHELDLDGDAETVWATLRVMPDPTSVLKVQLGTHDARRSVWSSFGINGMITARLQAFWTRTSGHVNDFPPGSVGPYCSTGWCHLRSGLEFASDEEKLPYLRYFSHCSITMDDPMLRHIKQVYLRCRGHLNFMPYTHGLGNYLDLFPNMEELVLQRAHWDPATIKGRECVRTLKSWLVTRYSRNIQPLGLRSVVFESCTDDTVQMYCEYMPNAIAPRMLCIDGVEDEDEDDSDDGSIHEGTDSEAQYSSTEDSDSGGEDD